MGGFVIFKGYQCCRILCRLGSVQSELLKVMQPLNRLATNTTVSGPLPSLISRLLGINLNGCLFNAADSMTQSLWQYQPSLMVTIVTKAANLSWSYVSQLRPDFTSDGEIKPEWAVIHIPGLATSWGSCDNVSLSVLCRPMDYSDYCLTIVSFLWSPWGSPMCLCLGRSH